AQTCARRRRDAAIASAASAHDAQTSQPWSSSAARSRSRVPILRLAMSTRNVMRRACASPAIQPLTGRYLRVFTRRARSYASEMDFRVLGPLAVEADRGQLPLDGPRARALLALLLLHANTPA